MKLISNTSADRLAYFMKYLITIMDNNDLIYLSITNRSIVFNNLLERL